MNLNPLDLFAHIGDDVKQFVQRQIQEANLRLEIKFYDEARALAESRLVTLRAALAELESK